MNNTKYKKVLKFVKSYLMTIVLVLLIVFFSIANEYFFTFNNLINVTRQVAVLGISGLGIAFVMLSGSLDLSLGSQMSLAAVIASKLMIEHGVAVPIAILATLITSTVVGLLIGYSINKLKLNPFIGTLAASTALGGVTYLLTNGATIQGFSEGYKFIGQGEILGIPVPIILMGIILLIGSFVLNKTIFGRYIYTVGGNVETARLSGIKTNLIKVIAFGIAGLLIGVAAIMQSSRLNIVNATLGSSYTFDAITANMLGGVSAKGGVGKISGILIGILIIGVLSNGMTLMGIQSYWQSVIKGMIMFFAIAMDSFVDRASLKA